MPSHANLCLVQNSGNQQLAEKGAGIPRSQTPFGNALAEATLLPTSRRRRHDFLYFFAHFFTASRRTTFRLPFTIFPMIFPFVSATVLAASFAATMKTIPMPMLKT